MLLRKFLFDVTLGFFKDSPVNQTFAAKAYEAIRLFPVTAVVNDIVILVTLWEVVDELKVPVTLQGEPIDPETVVRALLDLSEKMDRERPRSHFTKEHIKTLDEEQAIPLYLFLVGYSTAMDQLEQIAKSMDCTLEEYCNQIRKNIPRTTLTPNE
ncbi:MAG: hypothetical protein WC289_00050 [Patescibacteria group bacterium]|jgi:hypothetical protein